MSLINEAKAEESSESDGEQGATTQKKAAPNAVKKVVTKPLREITPESIYALKKTTVGDTVKPSNALSFEPT